MADVSEALSYFDQIYVVWTPRYRTKDSDGIIQTDQKDPITLKAVVVDAPLKTIMLLNDGSIGIEVKECYFAGTPTAPDGSIIDLEDTLTFNGADYTVRIPGQRTEGGYFKATVKRITRREITS